MGILNCTRCFCPAKCFKKKQRKALPSSLHSYSQRQSQVPEEKKKKKRNGNKHGSIVKNTNIRYGEQQPQPQLHLQSPAQKKKFWGWQKGKKHKEQLANFDNASKKEQEYQLQPQREKQNNKKRKKLVKDINGVSFPHEVQQPKHLKDKKKKKRRLLWQRKQEKKTLSRLSSLVNSLSVDSDSQMQGFATEEISRIDNENNSSHVFTFNQLKAATENFNACNLLGEGGFGRVYKGHIQETRKDIAVKVLDRHGCQGDREFLVEVLMLSTLHHPNLVDLLGYCIDNSQRILVYEYMTHGSLEDRLVDFSNGVEPFNWETRMKIAVGAAKGLEYLHDMAKPPVIYRDLKASNILLDTEFTPKLSDFGLAKLGPPGEKTHVTTRVMGTYGYCAPEYAMTGKLTKMSDIYSFGVIMLELITGRRAVDTTKPTREQILVQWAMPLFKDKSNFTQMVDPLLNGGYPLKSLYQALTVAALCLSEEASSRPVISDVVSALEFITVPKAQSLGSSGELSPPAIHPSYSDVEFFEACESDEDDL